jgi:moderate conductance mechanosensitive channel
MSAQDDMLHWCGSDPGVGCRLVWDITHNPTAATLTRNFFAGPVNAALRIVFVAVLALVIRAVLHRLIRRLTDRASSTALPSFLRRTSGGNGEPAAGTAAAAQAQHALVDERRRQRIHALGSILRSAASVTIFFIASMVILGDLGINLAPILASASVAGVAIGFGAQNLVKDYLAGIFMLLEDQYGVGDAISVGDRTGTVEAVTLRTTRLRDVSGIVWHIRNGTIDRVGNESQGWARAVIDYPLPYAVDLSRVTPVLEREAGVMWQDATWRKVMLEKPVVWGAQDVTADVVTVRIVARTAPLRQWEVERELRARLKSALTTAGIVPVVAEPAAVEANPPDGDPAG